MLAHVDQFLDKDVRHGTWRFLVPDIHAVFNGQNLSADQIIQNAFHVQIFLDPGDASLEFSVVFVTNMTFTQTTSFLKSIDEKKCLPYYVS